MSKQNLSDYIKSDLKNQILSDQCKVKLSLNDISKHYKVSTYPVRQAINTLLNETILVKGENGRLKVNPELKIDQVKKDEVIKPVDYFEEISNDLIERSFESKDVFIREIDTAETYQISQTQVRQIFGQLHGLGLLEHIQRQGWKLRTFKEKDFLAYCQVREMMEHKALDLSKDELEMNEIETFLSLNQYNESEDVYKTDEGFHHYIVKKSDNRYIKDFFERNGTYFKILSGWEVQMPDRAKETCSQHTEILSHILEKNWVAAKKAMSNHIFNNHPLLFKK